MLVSGLVVITVTDLREKLIFDITSIPLIPAGLVYNFFNIGGNGSPVRIPLEGINSSITLNDVFISAIIGAIIGAAFFEIFSRLGLLLVGEYAFGSGDSIIAAILGAVVRWKLVLAAIALSFLLQVFAGIPIMVNNMLKDKDYKSLYAMGGLLLAPCYSLFGTGSWSVRKSFNFNNNNACFHDFGTMQGGRNIKKNKRKAKLHFYTFCPALALGGLIVMFWGEEVLNWFSKIYM
ncbi:MAG: prepilin peptidase [Bacillus subtilis]|nr:prepilin peptidase [Bacillus subtilis]